MFARCFFKSRWICLYGASAIAAFSLGSTEWASDLFACTGETCLGGCLMVQGDGNYADENYCEVTSKNLFAAQMGIFCRQAGLQVPGPNVQPVKDGEQILANTNPPGDTLECDTLIQQSATWQANTLQLIDHTICPPQT